MITGIFFILIGVSILIKVLFKIDFPVVRLGAAVLLVYIGVRMFLGTLGAGDLFHWDSEKWKAGSPAGSVVFGEQHFKFGPVGSGSESTEVSRYSVVFGKAIVDLTQAPRDKDLAIDVNTVFGETVVIVDPKTPIHVQASSVFGEARLPDENSVAFGTMNYRNEPAREAAHLLRVRTNVVFGSIRFKAAQP